MLVVRHADTGAKGIGRGEVLVPVAVLGSEDQVGTTTGMGQAVDPGEAVRYRGAARRSHAESQRLRPVPVDGIARLGGHEIERLFPGDGFPPGIGLALGACAAHRREDALRGIDRFRRGLRLDAQGLAGWVVRVGIDPRENTVHHRTDAAATGDAQGAVAVATLGRHRMNLCLIRLRTWPPSTRSAYYPRYNDRLLTTAYLEPRLLGRSRD